MNVYNKFYTFFLHTARSAGMGERVKQYTFPPSQCYPEYVIIVYIIKLIS